MSRGSGACRLASHNMSSQHDDIGEGNKGEVEKLAEPLIITQGYSSALLLVLQDPVVFLTYAHPVVRIICLSRLAFPCAAPWLKKQDKAACFVRFNLLSAGTLPSARSVQGSGR